MNTEPVIAVALFYVPKGGGPELSRLVATHAIISGEASSEGAVFDPRIAPGNRPTIVRQISKPFADASWTVGEVRVSNLDGEIDSWVYDHWEGRRCAIWQGHTGMDLHNAVGWPVAFEGYIEDIEPGRGEIVFRLIDGGIGLDKRFSDKRWGANHKQNLHGQFKSTVIGRVERAPMRHLFTVADAGGYNRFQYSSGDSSFALGILHLDGVEVLSNDPTYGWVATNDAKGKVDLSQPGGVGPWLNDYPPDQEAVGTPGPVSDRAVSCDVIGRSLPHYTDNDGTLDAGFQASDLREMVSHMFYTAGFLPLNFGTTDAANRYDVDALASMPVTILAGMIVEDGGNILEILDELMPEWWLRYPLRSGATSFAVVPHDWQTEVLDATPAWTITADQVERDSLIVSRIEDAPWTEILVRYAQQYSETVRTYKVWRKRKSKKARKNKGRWKRVERTEILPDHLALLRKINEAQYHLNAAPGDPVDLPYSSNSTEIEEVADRYLSLYQGIYNTYEFRVRTEALDGLMLDGNLTDVFELNYPFDGFENGKNLWCTMIGEELGGRFIRIEGLERIPPHLPATITEEPVET